MAPVVTGPKRTNKKVFNQNPVFSVLADDGASTPERGRQSPSHGTESISKTSDHIANNYVRICKRSQWQAGQVHH
jgi:hypothetical protein